MTVTKNVYVLMLALVIVLSGCIGGTADGQDDGDCGESTEDCTTVIHNHYYNNTTTTTTTVIQESPEMISLGGFVEFGETTISTWETQAMINTSAGEMVDVVGMHVSTTGDMWTQIRIESICSGNIAFASTGPNSNQESISTDWSNPLPGSFTDCTHSIQIYDADVNPAQISWSFVYSILPVTVG